MIDNTEKSRSSSKIKVAVISVIGTVLAAIISGIFFINKHSDNQDKSQPVFQNNITINNQPDISKQQKDQLNKTTSTHTSSNKSPIKNTPQVLPADSVQNSIKSNEESSIQNTVPECEKKNTGGYSFKNNLNISVTAKMSKSPNGTRSFPLKPGEVKTFYELPIGVWEYAVWNNEKKGWIDQGYLNVIKCQTELFEIK